MQERRNAGKKECRKERMYERRDSGKVGFMRSGMQERRESGDSNAKFGSEITQKWFLSSLLCTTVVSLTLFLTISKCAGCLIC